MGLLESGYLEKVCKLFPGMDQTATASDAAAESEMRQMVGIIDSMTREERQKPAGIDANRGERIARGSGVKTKAVTELLKQFRLMAPVMTEMAGQRVNVNQYVNRRDFWRFGL